ncbi:MAG: type II toxin-antitoxin system PemK/MazF family toxin [Chitinophagaceae bacterium]|nr:MAG: type II toxin-antitoxin system PemK/MazF family toxin [Chitinophagaceae bacterium]
MKYKVVLVPFPFDDFSSTKVRPAVCLTEPISTFGHIIIAFITSKMPIDILPTDIVVDNSSLSTFYQTGLQVTSIIRMHKLTTIPTSLIKRELGQIPWELQPAIDKALIKLFSLQRV